MSADKKLQNFKTPVPGSEVRFWSKALKYYFLYNTFVIIVGFIVIIWGGWMVVNGIEGKVDWILKAFGNESALLNASPGVLLIVVGILIIIFAKIKVEHRSDK